MINETNLTKLAFVLAANGGGSGSGSSGGIMMVNVDIDTNMLDKTWQEIYDHINGGGVAFTKHSDTLGLGVSQALITDAYKESETEYDVWESGGTKFTANSPDDYPGPSES